MRFWSSICRLRVLRYICAFEWWWRQLCWWFSVQLLVVMIRPYSSCCAMFVRSSMIVCCSFCLPDCIFSNVKDVQVMIATNKKGEECFEAESPDEGQFFPKVCKSIPSRELTYPPKMEFCRWFSFSRLVGDMYPFPAKYYQKEVTLENLCCCTCKELWWKVRSNWVGNLAVKTPLISVTFCWFELCQWSCKTWVF